MEIRVRKDILTLPMQFLPETHLEVGDFIHQTTPRGKCGFIMEVKEGRTVKIRIHTNLYKYPINVLKPKWFWITKNALR